MKTILVDDDMISLQGFEIECGQLNDIEIVGKFTSPLEALAYAEKHPIDFALLDIDLPEMSGLELYDKLKAIREDMIIVFVTAHSGYAASALRKKADYVVFKPYDKEDVEDILKRIKLLKGRLKKRVYAKTFGHFNVFVDAKPVHFKLAKAKEILALCIYREGGMVSAEEIIDKLWESYNGSVGECSTFRSAVKVLTDTLKTYGCEEIFGRDRGMCYVIKDLIDSDYYDFLAGDPQALCEYQGEFMSDYSWGNLGVYTLNEKKALEKSTNLK